MPNDYTHEETHTLQKVQVAASQGRTTESMYQRALGSIKSLLRLNKPHMDVNAEELEEEDLYYRYTGNGGVRELRIVHHHIHHDDADFSRRGAVEEHRSKGILENAADWTREKLGSAKDSAEELGSRIVHGAESGVEHAREEIGAVTQAVKDVPPNMYRHATEGARTLSKATETAKEALSSLSVHAASSVDVLTDRVKQPVSSASSAASSIASVVRSDGRSLAASATSAAKSAAAHATGAGAEMRDRAKYQYERAVEGGERWLRGARPLRGTIGPWEQAPLTSFYAALLGLYLIMLWRRFWNNRKKTGSWLGSAPQGTAERLGSHERIPNGEGEPDSTAAIQRTTRSTRKTMSGGHLGQPTPEHSPLHEIGTPLLSEKTLETSTVLGTTAHRRPPPIVLSQPQEALLAFGAVVPFALMMLAFLEVSGTHAWILHVLYIGLIGWLYATIEQGGMDGMSDEWFQLSDDARNRLITGLLAALCTASMYNALVSGVVRAIGI